MSKKMTYLKHIKNIIKWFLIGGKWIIIFPFILLIIPFLILIFTLNYPIIEPIKLIEYVGIFLILFGIVLIIWGVDRKLLEYTDGGICGLYLKWLESKPRLGATVNLPTDSASIGNHIPNLQVEIGTEKMTLEEKVDFLIAQQKDLKKKIKNIEYDIRKNLDLFKSEVQRLEKLTSSKIEGVQNKLKKSFVGNIDMEFAGAISFLIGELYTSLPRFVLAPYQEVISIIQF